MSKEIPLTNGKGIAIVDDNDYEWLSQWKWRFHNGGYAIRTDCGTGKPITVLMHRALLNAGKGEMVDHENRNKLDNRRSNLRLATKQENNCNCPPRSNSTSGFKGVSWHARDRRWHAKIQIDNRTVHLGNFTDPIDAARAYDTSAREFFGEFAYLNFPDD